MKKNWFKLLILLCVIVLTGIGACYYFVSYGGPIVESQEYPLEVKVVEKPGEYNSSLFYYVVLNGKSYYIGEEHLKKGKILIEQIFTLKKLYEYSDGKYIEKNITTYEHFVPNVTTAKIAYHKYNNHVVSIYYKNDPIKLKRYKDDLYNTAVHVNCISKEISSNKFLVKYEYNIPFDAQDYIYALNTKKSDYLIDSFMKKNGKLYKLEYDMVSNSKKQNYYDETKSYENSYLNNYNTIFNFNDKKGTFQLTFDSEESLNKDSENIADKIQYYLRIIDKRPEILPTDFDKVNKFICSEF
jgi:hypothetical protein